MKIELDIDMEKFRWSLVGDGYLYDEVIDMSNDALERIIKNRIISYIEKEYLISKDIISDILAGRR